MSSFQPNGTLSDSESKRTRSKGQSIFSVAFFVALVLFFGFLGVSSTIQVFRDLDLESELRAHGWTLQARVITRWKEDLCDGEGCIYVYHVEYSYELPPTIVKEEEVSKEVYEAATPNRLLKIRVLGPEFTISRIEGNTYWGRHRVDALVGWVCLSLLLLFGFIGWRYPLERPLAPAPARPPLRQPGADL